MPERIDRVTVAMNATDAVTLSWNARQSLLDRLKREDGTDTIVTAFEAVGATRSVELTVAQRATLLQALERWASLAYDGFKSILPELEQLRHALEDDLAAAEQRHQ
jgi:hypothetical protein